jgi:hypothetical protein
VDRKERGQLLDAQVEDALHELEWQLQQGHSEGFLSVLSWYAKFHKYSPANALLIAMQCPSATLVAGYKKWESLGFHVRRGERGIGIRAPLLKKEIDPVTGEIKERLTGYIETFVFDISQTAEYPQKQPPPFFAPIPGEWDELYHHLKIQVMLQGVHVSEDPMPVGIHGMHSNHHIRISESIDLFQKVTCLIHEYVHHVAHGTPEKREGLTRNQREWEAESTVFTVCAALGIEHPYAKDYLLLYQFTTEDLQSVMRKIHELTKVVMRDLNLLQDLPISKPLVEAA